MSSPTLRLYCGCLVRVGDSAIDWDDHSVRIIDLSLTWGGLRALVVPFVGGIMSPERVIGPAHSVPASDLWCDCKTG